MSRPDMDADAEIVTDAFIQFRDVSMRFGSLWANRDISLGIRGGEIHAVAGENGAGKSTLMKILYGHLRPDEGEICIGGKKVDFRRPRDAMRAGVGMVHQQLLIFPQLTAFENVVVGSQGAGEPSGGRSRVRAREELLRLNDLFGFDLPLDETAESLSFAHRQQIELLRILYRKARILILDEPTSLLAPPEVDRLLGLLKNLRDQRHTILFISHRLAEIFAVADRISVLRRGRLAGTFGVKETTPREIASLVAPRETNASAADTADTANAADKVDKVDKVDVAFETGTAGMIDNGAGNVGNMENVGNGAGRPPAEPLPVSVVPAPPVALELRRVTSGPSGAGTGLRDFSLQIREGEIFGIAGVVGNGEGALARVLAGLAPVERGDVFLDGRRITGLSPSERLKMGLRRLPSNPLEEALLPGKPLWQNFLLGSQRLRRFQWRGLLLKDEIVQWAEEELRAAEAVYSDPGEPVDALSGGNLQKLVLARVLEGTPRAVVLEQPGRGLDFRAQERLHDRVRALNEKGTTFLIISYDLSELLALCHRIGVIYRGELAGVAEKDEASLEKIGPWMLGVRDERDEKSAACVSPQ